MSHEEQTFEELIQCEICGSFFGITGSQKSREKCTNCGHLQDIESRVIHVNPDKKNTKLCEICGLNYNRLTQHEKIHKKCLMCGFIPITKEEKAEHVKLCDNLQIQQISEDQIEEDDKTETIEEMYLIEVLTEPIMENVIIQLPENSDKEESSENNHLELSEKPMHKYKYKCKTCPYISTKQNIIRHGNVCVKRAIAHTCVQCDPQKTFGTMKALKQHLKDVHEGKGFTCHICTKSFARGSNLRRHVKCHERRS